MFARQELYYQAIAPAPTLLLQNIPGKSQTAIYSHENEKISYDLKCPLPHFMLSAAKHRLKAHTASAE